MLSERTPIFKRSQTIVRKRFGLILTTRLLLTSFMALWSEAGLWFAIEAIEKLS